MFKLFFKNKNMTGYTDAPRYVLRDERGVWVQCEADRAECIVVGNERFSVEGKNFVEDTKDTVSIVEIAPSTVLTAFNRNNINNLETLEELKAAVLDLYDAVLDLYQAYPELSNT